MKPHLLFNKPFEPFHRVAISLAGRHKCEFPCHQKEIFVEWRPDSRSSDPGIRAASGTSSKQNDGSVRVRTYLQASQPFRRLAAFAFVFEPFLRALVAARFAYAGVVPSSSAILVGPRPAVERCAIVSCSELSFAKSRASSRAISSSRASTGSV